MLIALPRSISPLALAAALPLGAAALAACQGDRPAPVQPAPPPSASSSPALAEPAPQPSAVPAPTPPSAAPAAPLPSGACKEITAANTALIRGKPEPDGAQVFLSSRGCVPAPGGAWALRVDSWERSGEWAGMETWRGTFSIVRLRGDEAPALEARIGKDPLYKLEAGVSHTTTDAPTHFDFNGDGDPEIFLSADHKEHEGPFTTSAVLLTLKKDKIVEYPGLPKAYRSMEDADHDGRPDIIYYPYAQERTSPCSGFDFEAPGPALLAHSLPDGTFSLDDAAAVAFARKSCSSPPSGEPIGPELCARLSGASAADALAMLKKECRPPAAGDDGCNAKEGVCYDFNDRARLLQQAPPLRITP